MLFRSVMEELLPTAAEKVLRLAQVRDERDWTSIVEACRKLTAENLQPLTEQ